MPVSASNGFRGQPATGKRSLQMRVVDPLREPAWDHVVSSHPDGSCFHTSAWAKVLHKTYKHHPYYLWFSRGRRLAALVPLMEVRSPFTGRRGVCLPFSDVCEPLIFDPDAPALITDQLVRFARERGWRHLEIRGGKSLQLAARPATTFYGHKLDLRSGLHKLFDRFHGSVRRAIRKAEKSGLTVEITSTRKAMLDFYRLHVRTRRRHGLPPQPLSFFLNIDEQIMRADLGFVTLVKNRTTPLAAAVFFCSGNAALFKFGASDERSHEFRGNNLAMWESIKCLCEKGFKTLHLGRTSIGNNDGLRRFKLSWGTEEESIEYFKFALRTQTWEDRYRSGLGLHGQLFRRLPFAVNRAAGTLIYSHLD